MPIILSKRPGGGGSGGGVTSISESGQPALTGAVTLSEGANISLTQAGQDIEIAANGIALRGARVFETANQTIPTGVVTAITFDSETFDTDGYHDNVTNNSRLTVPAGLDGYYLAMAGARWENGSGGGSYRRAFLSANGGTSFAEQIFPIIATNFWYDVTPVGIIFLNAGQYVQLLVDHDAGSDRLIEGSSFQSWLSIVRVGT